MYVKKQANGWKNTDFKHLTFFISFDRVVINICTAYFIYSTN